MLCHSNLITKTLQVGLNASAKLNHFRCTVPTPSTNIAAIANAFDKRPDIHFGGFDLQSARETAGGAMRLMTDSQNSPGQPERRDPG